MPMTPETGGSTEYSPQAANLSPNAQGDGEGLKGRISNLAQSAKDQASAAVAPIRENARSVVEEQKERGASRIDGLAQAIHGAANELDAEVPQAATYVHAAAEQLERASGLLRDNSVEDLVRKATDLAEERPVVFVAGAMAIGFVLARLLRSTPAGHDVEDDTQPSEHV
jgi:ElaB/YqjD/DUF883 family membrane-anchored ribosome-binding protein